MANANVDAEKIVFAVDIISFFMKKHYPHLEFQFGTHIVNVLDNYRLHVRQHFDENLKRIIDDIDDTQSFIVKRDFSEIEHKKGGISLSSLVEYTGSFKKCNLAKRYSAGKFLLFCARVSLMSCYFFLSGRKCDLDYVIDLIKTSFPDDEDECRLLWDEIDNAAENYRSNSKENLTPAVFGRKPSEPADVILSGREDSSKIISRGNSLTAFFEREVGEPADLISRETDGSSKSNYQENAISAVFDKESREITNTISTGTEDSCSSSSTSNTESDSSAHTQDMNSASSDESLTKLVLKLSEMAAVKCANNSKNKSTPAVADSNAEFGKYVESKPCATAAADLSTESEKCVENKQINTTTTAVSTSNPEFEKHVGSNQSSIEAAPAENLENSIQNRSLSSSTFKKCPKIQIDFKTRFENAFMGVKDELSLQSSSDESRVEIETSQKSPAKSPLKSALRKSPSPRKGKVSFSDDTGDDSETEIKKPKLRSPPKSKD